MISYHVAQVLALLIAIPAAIGVLRYNSVLPSFRPFILLICIGLANEIISSLLPAMGSSNAVNTNIYLLIEAFMLLWLFYRWSFQSKAVLRAYLFVAVTLLAIWITDNFLLYSLNRFNSIFTIVYSLVVLTLSVNQMNQVIYTDRGYILRNARFIICVAFLYYYGYRMIFEVFYIYDLSLSDGFYRNLYYILIVMNAICNLIFALAILWMPTKQRFTLPY